MRTHGFTEAQPSLSVLRSRLASLRLSLVSRQFIWSLKYGFNPSQPRVSRGEPDGGQWTDSFGGLAARKKRPRGSAPRQIGGGDRVAKPIPFEDSELARLARRLAGPYGDRVRGKPVRLAQIGRGPAGSGPRRTGGGNRIVDPTQSQESQLAGSRLMRDRALARVKEIDSQWKPTPSATETVRGEILANIADAREADARYIELKSNGIGPGFFAGESIPARSTSRNFTKREIEAINAIGRATGCHTCGAKESGSASGNFFKDHQLPTARGGLGQPQRIYPQCQNCSGRQGAWISNNRK